MLSVRTHAVACFVVGQGHIPVGVEYHGPYPVYIFRDDAHTAMKKYADARQLLAVLVEQTEVAR
jgi:hypothetical protein